MDLGFMSQFFGAVVDAQIKWVKDTLRTTIIPTIQNNIAALDINKADKTTIPSKTSHLANDGDGSSRFSTVSQLAIHKDNAVLDHPDGSVATAKIADNAVTDGKIGTRVIDSITKTLTQWLQWLYTEKVSRQFKTGSESEYKVLSDNNLDNTNFDLLDKAGTTGGVALFNDVLKIMDLGTKTLAQLDSYVDDGNVTYKVNIQETGGNVSATLKTGLYYQSDGIVLLEQRNFQILQYNNSPYIYIRIYNQYTYTWSAWIHKDSYTKSEIDTSLTSYYTKSETLQYIDLGSKKLSELSGYKEEGTKTYKLIVKRETGSQILGEAILRAGTNLNSSGLQEGNAEYYQILQYNKESYVYVRYFNMFTNNWTSWIYKDSYTKLESDSTFQTKITNGTKTATSTGIVGQQAYDNDYFYVCTATNTWIRFVKTAW